MGHLLDIEQLFRDYYEPLHRYAFTIVSNADDAEDVVQQAFAKLWEKRETISIKSYPKAYLYRIVYNESIDHLRKKDSLQKKQKDLSHLPEAESPNYFSAEEQKEIEKKINDVLNRLPPQCRTVFVKCRAEQKKHAEIAAELGISIKTVQAHMVKALKLIRETVGVNTLIVSLIYIIRTILKYA